MNYAEAKHRIIRKLPDDFLKDDGNRVALDIMENLFDVLDKDDIQPIDYMMCANADMAIYILEFIKQGYAKNYQDAGVKKYLAALQRGIDALVKQSPKLVEVVSRGGFAPDYYCPVCRKQQKNSYKNKSKGCYCERCGQALDWSKE